MRRHRGLRRLEKIGLDAPGEASIDVCRQNRRDVTQGPVIGLIGLVLFLGPYQGLNIAF